MVPAGKQTGREARDPAGEAVAGDGSEGASGANEEESEASS